MEEHPRKYERKGIFTDSMAVFRGKWLKSKGRGGGGGTGQALTAKSEVSWKNHQIKRKAWLVDWMLAFNIPNMM